jgi:hypothetical protein
MRCVFALHSKIQYALIMQVAACAIPLDVKSCISNVTTYIRLLHLWSDKIKTSLHFQLFESADMKSLLAESHWDPAIAVDGPPSPEETMAKLYRTMKTVCQTTGTQRNHVAAVTVNVPDASITISATVALKAHFNNADKETASADLQVSPRLFYLFRFANDIPMLGQPTDCALVSGALHSAASPWSALQCDLKHLGSVTGKSAATSPTGIAFQRLAKVSPVRSLIAQRTAEELGIERQHAYSVDLQADQPLYADAADAIDTSFGCISAFVNITSVNEQTSLPFADFRKSRIVDNDSGDIAAATAFGK